MARKASILSCEKSNFTPVFQVSLSCPPSEAHTCQVDGTQRLHGCKDLPGQVGWHGVQRPEGLLARVVHILPPEELEHSQLLLPLIRTPLPFLR